MLPIDEVSCIGRLSTVELIQNWETTKSTCLWSRSWKFFLFLLCYWMKWSWIFTGCRIVFSCLKLQHCNTLWWIKNIEDYILVFKKFSARFVPDMTTGRTGWPMREWKIFQSFPMIAYLYIHRLQMEFYFVLSMVVEKKIAVDKSQLDPIHFLGKVPPG